jgi:hypothetical protein
MQTNCCPSCGKPTLVPGNLVVSENYPIHGFAPTGTQSHVKLRIAFQGCTSCGHVGASVVPEELRSAIERHGNELVKQNLVLSEFGRYHDLPDIPEARQAADGVAEIDGCLLAGNALEALRRFRQLTGQSWDDVHLVMSKWADLKRPRKLALLGWRPKHEIDDDKVAIRDHPMHDHVLDG